MLRRTPHFIVVLALLVFASIGCEEVVEGLSEKTEDAPSSITITSGDENNDNSGNNGNHNQAADSTVYDFNDLEKACMDDNQFANPYLDLAFEETPRWAVCKAHTAVEKHDSMAIIPIDSRLKHSYNNGTTQLQVDRIILPEPADSVSLIMANYDRPLVNYVTSRNYASWLVAYDDAGNEIDRVLNSKGNHTGVVMVVTGSSETPIHTVGIETYPKSTYLDILTVYEGGGLPPDETPPEFTYTLESDSLSPADREMHLVVDNISASDNRGGEVTLTVSVSSSETVISAGDNTSPDWDLADNGDGSIDVHLRAEYSKSGNGRTYTVTLYAVDLSGNEAETSMEIVVPKKK